MFGTFAMCAWILVGSIPVMYLLYLATGGCRCRTAHYSGRLIKNPKCPQHGKKR